MTVFIPTKPAARLASVQCRSDGLLAFPMLLVSLLGAPIGSPLPWQLPRALAAYSLRAGVFLLVKTLRGRGRRHACMLIHCDYRGRAGFHLVLTFWMLAFPCSFS